VSVSVEAGLDAPGGDRRPSPFALLFAPDRGMEHQAKVGRARGILLFAWLGSLLLGVALALRVDAGSSTLKNLEMSGRLQGMSDRQIADEIKSAERVFEVLSVAKGVFGVPLRLGLACLAVLVLVWFFRGRTKGSAVVPVAAATLLPGALADLLDAAVAFRHAAMPPDGVPLAPRTLGAVLPLLGKTVMGPWSKLAGAVDFFSLWAAVMMAYGVVAVGGVPKRTALVGTMVAWVCYQLLTRVAAGGG
jgi:hypothetical protein